MSKRWPLVLVLTATLAGGPLTGPARAQGGAATAAPTAADLDKRLDAAEAELATGEPDAVLAAVRAVRDQAGKFPAVMVRALMLEGYAAVRKRDWPAAAAAFAGVVDKYHDAPVTPDALQQLGRVQAAQGREKEAQATWQRVLTEAPSSLAALAAERLTIDSLVRSGDLKAAGQRLEAVLARMPWFQAAPDLLAELGGALLEKDPAGALARFEQLRAQYPGTRPAYQVRRSMVEALGRLKRVDDALKLLDAAATTQADLFTAADVADLRTSLLVGAGRGAEAVQGLDALAARYPGTYVAAEAVLQAVRLLREKDPDGALQRLTALQAACPGPWWQAQLLPVRIDLARAKKDWDQAEDAAKALVTLTDGTPVAADTLLQMARIQREAGRKKAARATLERVAQTYKGAPVVPIAQALLAEWDAADKTA